MIQFTSPTNRSAFAATNLSANKAICVYAPERANTQLYTIIQGLDQLGHIALGLDNRENHAANNLKKLELCDELLVLNLDGHIDDQTRQTVVMAQRLGKVVRFSPHLILVCTPAPSLPNRQSNAIKTISIKKKPLT